MDNGRIEGQMDDGWMTRRMDGWIIDEWMNRRMDGYFSYLNLFKGTQYLIIIIITHLENLFLNK